MKLNDRQIKNAKPAEKPFKLNDGKSLYLNIKYLNFKTLLGFST